MENHAQFCNLIWDFDGTLFDTIPAMVSAFAQSLKSFGVDAEEEKIEGMIRLSIGKCIGYYSCRYGLDESILREGFLHRYENVPLEKQPLMPGALHVCETVRRIGGCNIIVSHRSADSLARFLRAYQIEHLFDGWLSAVDGYPRKPDPFLFNMALERYGIDRESTIALGDREIDIDAGRRAGLLTVALGEGEWSRNANLVISHLDELIPWIAGGRRP